MELKEHINLFDDYASSRYKILVLAQMIFVGKFILERVLNSLVLDRKISIVRSISTFLPILQSMNHKFHE